MNSRSQRRSPKRFRPDPLELFDLARFLDPLVDHPSFAAKKMFGGLAVYFESRMVLILTESPGDRVWRGVDHGFEIWNGVLVATDYSHHSELQSQFAALQNHPVLKKWLYLPLIAPEFETALVRLVEGVRAGDERIGVAPSVKKRTSKKRSPKSGIKKRKKSS